MIFEKKFGSEPIRLKKKVSLDRISALKEETWTFSGTAVIIGKISGRMKPSAVSG